MAEPAVVPKRREGEIGGNGNSFKSHDHVLKSNGCRLKESHPIKEGSERGSMSHGPIYIYIQVLGMSPLEQSSGAM